ncbi:RFC5-like protein [Mya arenaria]|uniref:RFC5-like protein n=1 Tax=Mya arenaria TaxID=6604 RepID=A0ABY7DU40_MYAAR|nr:RFC5-like protein [Mya arenaria]
MTETAKSSPNLPWVEKYRPKKLDDLISHQDIISTINKFVFQNRLPHLLFYGPPGTGKTSTILAVAKQMYAPNEFHSMVLELNASDDRGIGIVRGQVLSFASTRTIFKKGFKLVILDEADAMTRDAQNSLRRALQSRCTRFRFAPLSTDQMLPRLQHVIEEEKVIIDTEGVNAVVTLANGDMRKSLNILQSCSMAYDSIDEDCVYTCVGHPLRKDIENIVYWILNENFTTAYNILAWKNSK